MQKNRTGAAVCDADATDRVTLPRDAASEEPSHVTLYLTFKYMPIIPHTELGIEIANT